MSFSALWRIFSRSLAAWIAIGVVTGVASAATTSTAAHTQFGATGLVRASQSLSSYWSKYSASARSLTVTLSSKPASRAASASPQGTAMRIPGAVGSLGASQKAASALAGSIGSRWYWNFYRPPATTTGKVFFTDHLGGRWVCSGSLVNSAGKDLVITAGHCVYGTAGGELPAGEGWHRNWVFAPDYYNGWAPYGYWTARQLWTMTNYIAHGDEQDDVGAVLLYSNSSGTKAVNLLGGQGIAWNQPSSQYIYDFGYPAAYPFNGQTLQYCNGQDFYSIWIGMELLHCNFTGGSSGGPWLMGFNGTLGYVNSVNDAGYSLYPGYIAGLYFGNNAANLYTAVKNL